MFAWAPATTTAAGHIFSHAPKSLPAFGGRPAFTEARRALVRRQGRLLLLRLARLAVIAGLPNKYTGKWKSTNHYKSKVTGSVRRPSRMLVFCVMAVAVALARHSGSHDGGVLTSSPYTCLQEMRLNEKIRGPRGTSHPIRLQRPASAPRFRPNKAFNWPPRAVPP